MTATRTAPASVGNEQQENEQRRALEAQLGRIRSELSKWNRGDVLGRRRIGQLVRAMLDTPDRYGQRIIPTLVENLGYGETWLYECQQVARTWTEDQLGELLRRRDQVRGLPLNWSHLVALASKDDGRERRKWINLALKEGLTASQLRARMDGPAPATEASAAGNPGGRWLREIRASAEAAVSKQRQWEHTLFRELAERQIEIDPQEVRATLTKAREAKEGYESLIAHLQQAIEER